MGRRRRDISPLSSSPFFPKYGIDLLYNREWTLSACCNWRVDDHTPAQKFFYFFSLYEEDRRKKEKEAREAADKAATRARKERQVAERQALRMRR